MPTPTTQYRVILPGAEDLFNLIPDSALPPEIQRARRAERARRIQESPTPEIARDYQNILTRIDNLQDAFATLALITRLAVPSFRPLAPLARATATAADVLNITQALRTIIPGGGSGKAGLFRQLEAIPTTYRTRLTTTLRTGRAAPGYGEILQVLQTARDLTGAGLILGPLMGLPTELISLAIRGGTLELPIAHLAEWATLAPLFLTASPWLQIAGLAAGFALSSLSPDSLGSLTINIPALLPTDPDLATLTQEAPPFIPTITALETAEQALTDAAYLDGLSGDLTPTEHAIIDLTRYMALSLLGPITSHMPNGILLPEKRSLPYAEPPGTPKPLAWLDEHPTHPAAIAVASLTSQAAAAIALSLEGPNSLEPPTWPDYILSIARAYELATPLPEPIST